MDRIRGITRAICAVNIVWAAVCAAAAAFLLSDVPLARGESIMAAGLPLDADIAYAVAGSVMLLAAAFSFGACLYGMRCIRLVRHVDALRGMALFGAGLSLAALVACLAVGRLGDVGWIAFVATATLFSLASLAGEMSRALIAACMRSDGGTQ